MEITLIAGIIVYLAGLTYATWKVHERVRRIDSYINWNSGDKMDLWRNMARTQLWLVKLCPQKERAAMLRDMEALNTGYGHGYQEELSRYRLEELEQSCPSDQNKPALTVSAQSHVNATGTILPGQQTDEGETGEKNQEIG